MAGNKAQAVPPQPLVPAGDLGLAFPAGEPHCHRKAGKQMLNCFLCNPSIFPPTSQQVQQCLSLVYPTGAQHSLRSCHDPHGWCWPRSVCSEVPRAFSQITV